MSQTLLTLLIASTLSSAAYANTDVLHYAIGGGPIVSLPSREAHLRTVKLGVGWDMNLQCGLLDPKVTIQNQLNGVTEGFQDMMGDMLSNATAAVASLPGYFIQKRDPGLYDLLTNGVLQGKFDFDNGRTSCETMTEQMGDILQGSDYNATARAKAWTQAVKSGDAVRAKEKALNDMGNSGITWVGGQAYGGRNQPPLDAPKDAANVGFKMLTEDADKKEGLYRYWDNADALTSWLTTVIGSRTIQTGLDKSQTQATAGVGLSADVTQDTRTLEQELQTAIEQNQESEHFPKPLIEALSGHQVDDAMVARIGSELAVSHSIEKALHARRALLTGKYEVNLAQHQLAQEDIDHAVLLLEKEIELLKFEAQARQSIGSRTAVAVVNAYQQQRTAQRPTQTHPDSQLLRQQLSVDKDN